MANFLQTFNCMGFILPFVTKTKRRPPMNINPFNLAAATFLCAFIPAIASAASISGQGTWETTLHGRDLNGDGIFDAYYDTLLGITWLANANQAGTTMTWATANAWVAGLDIHGITGWRLPDTNPVNGSMFNENFAYDGSTDYGNNVSAPGTVYAGSSASEMAHMFYNTLGNHNRCSPSTSTASSCADPQPAPFLSNTGPFNLQNGAYWSGTSIDPVRYTLPDYAWYFNFDNGQQGYTYQYNNYYRAWAVHDGDVGVSIVPVPAAVWLFGSGLLGLLALARKRRA
jgi:hypothetical protein